MKKSVSPMGYRLQVSWAGGGDRASFSPVGRLFSTRFEAETYRWRYYTELPYRVVGVSLSVASSANAAHAPEIPKVGA